MSTPFYHALTRRIDQLGGVDKILDEVADDVSLEVIAARLGCSRRFLNTWLLKECPDGWADARRARAMKKAEDGQRMLDAAQGAVSPVQVSAAVAGAKYRQWFASKLDRETFGETPQKVEVNVSVGQLHLDALRAARPRELPGPVVDRPELVEVER